MPRRTQIVCLHEGVAGRSIDPVFYLRLVQVLDPKWVRPWTGRNAVRMVNGNGRKDLMAQTPGQIQACRATGGLTTLVVCADLDDDMPDGETLRKEFWITCNAAGISRADFETVVFIFAKDRLENWIEFLLTGSTDEGREGPRVADLERVALAAQALGQRCNAAGAGPPMPPSLEWSCANWRALVERMKE